MTIKDFKKGDTVFVLLTGNAARGRKGDELIEEWEVTAVGRKYVTAKRKNGVYEVKFAETDFCGYNGGLIEKTQYCVDYLLYKDEQQIKDIVERDELETWCYQAFRAYGKTNYTLEQLRAVKRILEGV